MEVDEGFARTSVSNVFLNRARQPQRRVYATAMRRARGHRNPGASLGKPPPLTYRTG
jgi:hypothetical protein